MNTKNSNSSEPVSNAGNPDSAGSFLGHLWAAIAFTFTLGIVCCVAYPAIVWGLAQTIFPGQANGSLVKADGTSTTNDKEAVGSSLLGQAFTAPQYFHPRPSAANNSAGSSFSPTGGYDPTASGGTNYGPLSDELIDGLTTSPTPPATQPAESLTFDGVRLRTIHYAVDNNISFKLYHAVYVTQDDGTMGLSRKDEVPLKTFQDAQGNLNDVALVDAFPHPTPTNINATHSEYTRTVIIAGDFSREIPGDAVTASGSGLDPHISPENAAIQAQRVADARHIPVEKLTARGALIDQRTDQPGLGFLGDPGVNVLMLNLALDAAYPVPVAQPPPAVTTGPTAGAAVPQAPTTQPAK
jgi:K+-transporting ATPase ATPase C chain